MAGMSSPYGQGIQYLQSLQGMVSKPIISVAVSCRNAKSSSVSGFKGEYVRRLSCKCSMRVMPLSTVWTPGRLPAKRNAHEATLLSGSRCLRRAKMVLGTLERRPPNSGFHNDGRNVPLHQLDVQIFGIGIPRVDLLGVFPVQIIQLNLHEVPFVFIVP